MVEHSPQKNYADELTRKIILEGIKASTLELRTCIREVDDKIDNAMKMIQRLETTCIGLDQRLTTIEKDNQNMKNIILTTRNNQESSQMQLDDLAQDVANVNKNIREEVNEQLNRFQRRLNIIVKGIPEDLYENKLMTELFSIIWPNNSLPSWSRLGEKKSSDPRPRIIRITLPSVAEKRLIFQKCKLLKNLDKFKGISVCRDQTKQQQAENQRVYSLRSGLKRKNPCDEEMDVGPTRKITNSNAELK